MNRQQQAFERAVLIAGGYVLSVSVLAMLGQAIKHESRSMHLERQLEAMKRLHGKAASPAYICFDGATKAQLENLLH